jgi:hypothetical protein
MVHEPERHKATPQEDFHPPQSEPFDDQNGGLFKPDCGFRQPAECHISVPSGLLQAPFDLAGDFLNPRHSIDSLELPFLSVIGNEGCGLAVVNF